MMERIYSKWHNLNLEMRTLEEAHESVWESKEQEEVGSVKCALKSPEGP
jgi:hypothetical protein